MNDTIYRITFSDGEDLELAEDILDEAGAWYDFDSGDRMMINQDGINVLDEADIDYDEV